jgi:predicted NUDIX family NTP pyrophosphohydrolase
MTTTVNSYGILLYREGRRKKKNRRQLEVFLIKPNGPHFWSNPKMVDVWGIPKGRMEAHEEPMEVAHREFYEEVGVRAPADLHYQQLTPLVTYRGKVITIYAADASGRNIEWAGSNIQSREWPVGSGRNIAYCETVAGGWFTVAEALRKIGSGQRAILQDLLDKQRQPIS